jgi:hypothetical protein
MRSPWGGNRRFSGARMVPGADVWLGSETSRGLDPDGCVVRRREADTAGTKTGTRLRPQVRGRVGLVEHNGKKWSKVV